MITQEGSSLIEVIRQKHFKFYRNIFTEVVLWSFNERVFASYLRRMVLKSLEQHINSLGVSLSIDLLLLKICTVFSPPFTKKMVFI